MRWMIAAALLLAGCGSANESSQPKSEATVTVASAGGARVFEVDLADTVPEQAHGLKFRTDIAPNGGMLFAPYPAEGGGPRAASFWMKDTPSALDILFIRADGTIARIAENTVPFSEAPVPSEEPVAAVLEIRGGRAGELGIAEGDRVRWTVH